MTHFDHDFLAGVIERLGQVAPDTLPAWGTLTPREMVAHLVSTIRYSMGKAGDLPDQSNWFTRRVVAPLVLGGFVGIPRNIKAPYVSRSHDDVETLQAVLEDYLALVQAGELDPKHHPLLGDIGVDGWDRLHVLHFNHHLRQFGV